MEAAKALVAQVKQELTAAIELITSAHPPEPASLELTTRKLLITSGLLARHLTVPAAFEEALPTFADELFIPLLKRREQFLAVVRFEGMPLAFLNLLFFFFFAENVQLCVHVRV